MCGIFLARSKKYLDKKRCVSASKLIKSRGPDFFLQKFF